MLTEKDNEKNIKLLQKLIQNKCVNPPGDELRSIKTIEEYLKNYGIVSEIFEVSPNRACLLAKLDGKDPQAPQIILGPAHVDVVPVTNPEGWKHDPFAGVIEGDFIYGRGTSDMLYQVSTQVAAFAKMKEDKIELKGNVYLWIVPDEELGGEHGTKWFLKNHKEKLQLSETRKTYALSEGVAPIIKNYFSIYGIGQKGPIWKKLIFKGTAIHGSLPYHADNALLKAAQAAQKFQAYNERTDIEAIDLTYLKKHVEKFVKYYPEYRGLMNEETFGTALEEQYKKDQVEAKMLHSMTKTTYNPTQIKAGTNTNIVPDKAELTLDIRAMPKVKEEEIEKGIKEILGELAEGIEIESTGDIKEFVEGTVSEPGSEFVKKAQEIVKETYPEIEFVPFMGGGATDARFCRLEGIECYELGISDPKRKPSETGPAHGTNERIDLKRLELYLEFLYKLLVRFNGR